MKKNFESDQDAIQQELKSSVNRRKFLKIGGLAVAGSGLLLYGCDTEDIDMDGEDVLRKKDGRNVFNLGKGDLGILNYAYLLEQLEAAFYTEVKNRDYVAAGNDEERKVLMDLYTHEVIHRDWFKAVISTLRPSEAKKPPVEFDFGNFDFTDRDSVFQTAIALEDTGVSAYNGAGPLLENSTYLLLAGKIVSVEARHASAVRSLYYQGTSKIGNQAFAGDDVVDMNGLDLARTPQEVLQIVDSLGWVQTKIISNQLPG